MGKKLAIRGHSTRGKEVIEILEMMGGINESNISGKGKNSIYYLRYYVDNVVADILYQTYPNTNDDDFKIFTLEEFLEKYPFKVGDKIDYLFYTIPITVKSMSWSEDYCTMVYDFVEVDDVLAAEDLDGCKKVGNIGIKLDKNVNMNVEFDLTKYSYEVKDGKLIIEEKKPKYPMTYKECRAILDNYITGIISGYKASLLASLRDLLVCRDAYWKIAGEEMGLGKPWETGEEDEIFIIGYNRISDIYKSNGICTDNFILSFPTAEMRDAFYENFKDLIEQCKELL